MVAAGSAYLLPPADLSGDFPDEEWLGSPSPQTYKASRDYVIPDPLGTRQLRQEAAKAVRPVYDLDTQVAPRLQQRLNRAFVRQRRKAEQSLASLVTAGALAAENGNSGAGELAGDSGDSSDHLSPARLSAANRDEYLREMEGERSEFIKELQVVVSEAEFRELALHRFSPSIQKATWHLVHGLLSGEIAPSTELLKAERSTGITVRPVGSLQVSAERDLNEVERIPDLATLRAELLRLGRGQGESPSASGRTGRLGLSLSPELNPSERRLATALAANLLQSNLSYNAAETAQRKRDAAEAVKPVVQQYLRGERIVSDGERIEGRHLVVFRFIRDEARAVDRVRMRGGAGLFAVLVVLAVHRLSRRTLRRFRPTKRDLLFLSLVLLGNLWLQRAGLNLVEHLREHIPYFAPELSMLLLPLCAGTLLVRMLRVGGIALSFALAFLPLTLVQLHNPLPAVVGLVAGLAGAEQIARGSQRWGIVRGAILAGIAAALTVLSLALLSSRPFQEDTLPQMLAAVLGSAIISPVLARLFVPLFEKLFGFVSHSRLWHLASLNHPAMKDLIIQAPGTYHHSLLVGTLAEAGARAIGADRLLARVGGQFHDLGKVKAPLLYSENRKREVDSELELDQEIKLVHSHVAEGVKLAAAAHIPKAVSDLIAQHQGTLPAHELYNKACAIADAHGDPLPSIQPFRYPGPLPKSPEAALVMIANQVESAARKCSSPTPARLRELVPEVVHPIVTDGQLAECDLSLAELEKAIAAMQAALVDVIRVSPIEGD